LAHERRKRLLEEPVGATLVRLALPMAVGVFAILFFNLVDTFWVGQLGAPELAAMGFTFPVAMVVTNLTIGLSVGATAVIAQAIGEGHEERVKRLTTDSLVLALIVVAVLIVVGLLTLDPLFRALGADAPTLALIREYMVPWYCGVGFLVIPMVGNGAIRAGGDTISPAVVMLVVGLVNAVLDPLLIFGLGPFPELRLQGAALATVASYVLSASVCLGILGLRERMLTFTSPALAEVLRSWRGMLRVGLPAAGTNLLTPLAGAVVTRLVAGFGNQAVAAYGVGTRLEGLSMVGIFAMTGAITPFVGQNLGAGKLDRIWQCLRFSVRASLLWGFAIAAFLSLLAEPLARVFNADEAVVGHTVAYLRIVPLSYFALSIALLVASMFNAMSAPLRATFIAFVRLVVLAIPLAWVGARLFGLEGLFAGIAAANVAVAGVALALAGTRMRQLLGRRSVPGTAAVAAPAE
jgi:putative MATE family efflux protein